LQNASSNQYSTEQFAMSPKVFISHSAKDGAVQQVLWEIYHTLADDGYEPLLDLARLRENVGSPWRATLNTWMELCDGAIVLVDKRARDVSKWVPHEAGILSWRRHSDSDFVLIPIVISPVLPEDLGKEAFEPANLAALQTEVISLETQPEYPRHRQGTHGSSQRARGGSDPDWNDEHRLAALLGNVDEESLHRAAQSLGEDLRGWHPNLVRPLALARLLLKADIFRACKALQELVSLNVDQKHKIVNLIAPAWVDLRAVRPIREIIHCPAHERCIAVNGSEILTLRMYLLRASGLPTNEGWPFFELTTNWTENPTRRSNPF
jgi:hypothetical protein